MNLRRGNSPAIRLYDACSMTAEGFTPRYSSQLAAGFEGNRGCQALLIGRAVRTNIQTVGGLLVEVADGSLLLVSLGSLAPVGSLACKSQGVLIFGSLAFPCYSHSLGCDIRHSKVERSLAGSTTGKGYTFDIGQIDLVRLIVLMESHEDTLAGIGTQINSDRLPVGLGDSIGGSISGCVACFYYGEVSYSCTILRHLNAQFALGCVIVGAYIEAQTLTGFGTQLRSNQIRLIAIRTWHNGTSAVLLGCFAPSVVLVCLNG